MQYNLRTWYTRKSLFATHEKTDEMLWTIMLRIVLVVVQVVLQRRLGDSAFWILGSSVS